MWKWIKALNPFAAELKNTKGLLEFARVALDEALAQLAQAEIDLADKAFYVREFAAVSQERDGLKAELADLRERAAVLAGVGQPSSNTGQLDTDQVEALARVLHEAEPSMPPATYRERNEALARAAIAHLRKRPEGLPTAEELAKIACEESGINWNAVGADGRAVRIRSINAILAALAPYLRDPVEFELDVTESELHDAWRDHPNGYAAILDLCRSRISPTYECKECKRRSNMIPQIIADVTAAAAGAARAALDGE